MTVRDVVEKVGEIDFIITEISRASKDLDLELVSDILEEYKEVLLDKIVK